MATTKKAVKTFWFNFDINGVGEISDYDTTNEPDDNYQYSVEITIPMHTRIAKAVFTN